MQVSNPGRPVFVPVVYRLAARIEQTPLLDVVSDATAYANVLEGAWKLLRQDAIVTNFDPGLEAEIFGCQLDWPGDYDLPVASGWTECDPSAAGLENSGRVPVMLEAIKRLIQTRGREVAIIGVTTGPCSLARTIEEHAVLDREYPFEEIIALAGGQLTKLTRAFGEVKVDGLIIREDLLGGKYYGEFLNHEKACAAVYATIFNLTRFYNVAGLLMVGEPRLEDLAALSQKTGPSGLMLGGRKLSEADLAYLKDLSVSQKLAVGLPLSLADPEEAFARLETYEDFIEKNKPGGFFYTSDREVPPDVPLEAVRDVISRIKGAQVS
jgi:hypothetical protein